MKTGRFWILALVLSLLGFSADTPLWTEFVQAKKNGGTFLLPDYSYAGYAHGEKSIPDIQGPVFKVRDYGAIPDDETPDFEGIQKAIEAAQGAGGGVILFEKGTYLINTDEETANKARIKITNSGVILRGVGSQDGAGTILYSPVQMQPEDPKQMWSGRCPIVVSGLQFGTRRAKVTRKEPLNSMRIQVDNGATFKAGDRIRLGMTRKGEKAASFVEPHEWDKGWKSISIRELHEIAGVEGNAIQLAEPLMIPIDDGGDWYIQDVKLLSNIGIENLRFKGNWKEKFVHHRSWRDDSAFRGLTLTGVENSWIRNCVFEDMNWALFIASSRQVTCEDLRIVGTPAHFGMQVNGTYGVLGLKVRDESGEHHGPSLQSASCATVYHQSSWRPNGSFDSHANNPYSTLHDCNEGGLSLGGVGGSGDNFPHHLHGLVFWNQHLTGRSDKPTDFWSFGKGGYGVTFVQVILAGFHGESQEFVESAVHRMESPGQKVTPESLWLAQLELRLGKIPDHFKAYVR